MLTTSQKYKGSSIAVFKDYDDNYNDFFPYILDLNIIPGAQPDTHVAGLLMGVGISHSTMELRGNDNVIEVGYEGGSKTFTVAASTKPETWRLLQDYSLCSWASFTAEEKSEGIYDVTITVDPNYGSAVDVNLRPSSSGSYITFNVKQESGMPGIVVDSDADAPVEYYNLQGVRVEEPHNGVFIRRQGSKAEKVILK